MIIIRMALAFGILMFTSIFLFGNIVTTTGGGGYGFFYIAILSFLVLVTLSGDLLQLLIPRKQTVMLLAFFAYYFVKFYFESGDYEATKGISIGTTHGVLFSFAAGLMCSYAVATLYCYTNAGSARMLLSILCLAFLGFVLFEAYRIFQSQISQVRSDVFLTGDSDLVGTYQRRGDFIIIQFLLAVSVAILLVATQKRASMIVGIVVFFIIASTAFLYGATSQILGSNKGLISTMGFMYIFIAMLFVFAMKHSFRSGIKLSDILAGPLGFKLAISGIVSLIVVGAVAVVLLKVLNFDVSNLRITDYGGGQSTSVESRFEIFRTNFIPHFSYSPIFGHTHVEELVGGNGHYIHSIFSILTHLGLVGGVLFFFMVIFNYITISSARSKGPKSDEILDDNRYGLYRLLALSATIVMCGYSAFFNWMPLWFSLGMFGEWFFFRYRLTSIKQSRRGRSGRRRRRMKG